MLGRRKPYTDIGVRRLLCVRCEERRAVHQWQICSDGNLYRPICRECDVELNYLVLYFMGLSSEAVDEKMEKYDP